MGEKETWAIKKYYKSLQDDAQETEENNNDEYIRNYI